jgi:hypothetical protein
MPFKEKKRKTTPKKVYKESTKQKVGSSKRYVRLINP